ncbi:MAG TPA: bestrophin family ion channel [Chitinophaga sp.]|uniref:bestrophin family protein n=1 Tax=Chitinophaga sp. TaxID=1869181 RepID=UPI002CE22CD4|nr:bestrophin family ion channel [Chitinophaga sp.]HVI47217.1 bestrophin family ion channel [Chitinophaga sp.]
MLLKKNIPLKYVFGKIKLELMMIAIYTLIINLLYYKYNFTNLVIPLAVPMVLGTVLSVLLAFRSNQAYDRWWEARTIWGAIVNDSRSLSRQVLSLMDATYQSEELQHFQERFVKRQAAWCYSLGQSLRRTDPLKGLDRLLTKRELNYVMRYDNVPAALLLLHGKDLKFALEQGWINPYQQMVMDETISRLCDSMGKCERIKNTVFPATYSLYTHFTMLFFIMLLPFSLINIFGFMEIPVVMAIASSFLLIEKMGVNLQDPFENKPTDTPVTTIARTIERDLRQMLHEQFTLEAEGDQNRQYYVL